MTPLRSTLVRLECAGRLKDKSKPNRSFSICLLFHATSLNVFLLFFLGGLVRATGSGMGCPDWPKCFGLWAPPNCECKLPANYQEIYLQKRLQKVERFA
ncbi:MAG: COX15/CtaA family protein, partial [Planctomycetota bacterium]